MAKEHGKQELTRTSERAPIRTWSPFDEMERMMEGFFPRGWMRPFSRWERPLMAEAPEAKIPAMDVIDREAEILVRAELPGVKKDDLEVSTTDNTVTIKGSTSYETEEEHGQYYRCEISRGAFARTIALPSEVDSGKGTAQFKDGVLELKLPKIEQAKRRTIQIQ